MTGHGHDYDSEVPTVSVLVSGTGMDLTVHAVIDGDRGAAEKLAARLNDGVLLDADSYYVEALPVVGPDVEQARVVSVVQDVWDDGGYGPERVSYALVWPWEGPTPQAAWRWVRTSRHAGRGGRLEASGTDQARVLELAAAMRDSLRADEKLRRRAEASGGPEEAQRG